jgi:hypothetical protein
VQLHHKTAIQTLIEILQKIEINCLQVKPNLLEAGLINKKFIQPKIQNKTMK